jgi:DNA-binding NarL/FixJ family response regulator
MIAPKPTQPVRIVVADDHPIARSGLRWLLESESGLIVVGQAGDGSQAVDLVRDQRADILLLDLALCRDLSLDKLKDISASRIDVRIIVLADSVDSPDLTKALQLGVSGVILKDSTADVLFKCIHSVMDGYYCVDSDQVTSIPSSLHNLETERRRQKAIDLTGRELEIIKAVVAGYSNKEIGQRSSITENTVKSHLTRIFDKIGASNRVELALFAAHHRLLDGV